MLQGVQIYIGIYIYIKLVLNETDFSLIFHKIEFLISTPIFKVKIWSTLGKSPNKEFPIEIF